MRMPLLTLALAATGLAAAAQAQTGAVPPPPPPLSPPPGGPMLRADLDHDGVITRAEAAAEAGSRFDAMDANHDGTLTADERQAYRAAMRAQWRGDGKAAPPAPPAPPPAAPGGDATRGVASVTRADYVARATARFDRMDANHDGKLDRDEMARMRPFGGRRGGDMPPPPASDQ